MTGKAFLFITCVFGAFLQTQASPVDGIEEYKPDIRYLQVEVDDKEYNLTLVQRLHEVFLINTPVWTIQSTEDKNVDKITLLEYPKDKIQVDGIFYSDSNLQATLLATWDGDVREIYYNGIINIGTTIHKVESAIDEWWQHPWVYPSGVINRARNSKLRSSYVSKDDEAELLDRSLTILYPKILAVVDYDLYTELGKSVEKVVEYVATFWNAVDLKYSQLNSPDVRILVTGVLIVQDEHVSLTNGDFKSLNENFIGKMGFLNYDSAFIMSKSSAGSRQGQTLLGSICNRQNSIALVQDDGNYGGLFSATHELGHLLNIPHDGMDGAEKCADNSATLMSTSLESVEQLTWSQCSRDILQEFTKSKAAACLQNYWRIYY